MATTCNKCGGIIPDVCYDYNGMPVTRDDCRFHRRPTLDIEYADHSH